MLKAIKRVVFRERQFVARLYRDLLKREVDPGALAIWCEFLSDGNSRKDLIRKIKNSPECRGKNRPVSGEEVNWVLPDVWKQPFYQQKLILSRLSPEARRVALLGTAEQVQPLQLALQATGRHADGVRWDWDQEVDLSASSADVFLVCSIPVTARQWWVIHRLKERYGERVVCVQELALPVALLEKAKAVLPYNQPLEGLMPYLLGEAYLGGMDELEAAFPLAGKSVIEFGPLDGAQTGGLVKAGARVTCIESRPENAIKMILNSHVFGWDNVRIVLDDFHNSDAVKCGTFDLAIAHGVYYHSVAPFLFLENLLSLSRNVFVGGFCATERRPTYAFDTLEHRGATYRAKPYQEMVGECTAGVNNTGYFFHGDDLMEFFRRRGCEVTVLQDLETEERQPAGRYVHFLARKQS